MKQQRNSSFPGLLGKRRAGCTGFILAVSLLMGLSSLTPEAHGLNPKALAAAFFRTNAAVFSKNMVVNIPWINRAVVANGKIPKLVKVQVGHASRGLKNILNKDIYNKTTISKSALKLADETFTLLDVHIHRLVTSIAFATGKVSDINSLKILIGDLRHIQTLEKVARSKRINEAAAQLTKVGLPDTAKLLKSVDMAGEHGIIEVLAVSWEGLLGGLL